MFTLIGSDGENRVLQLASTSIKLDAAYYALEIVQCDALTWLSFNGEDIELDGITTLHLPIVWQEDYIATLTTWIDANEYTFKFYFDEKKIMDHKLQIAYNEFRNRVKRYFGDKKSIIDVVSMVNNGTIPLLSILNPDTEVNDDSIIKHIDEKLQFAFNICNRPRMHLKSEIELLDIERVKRVNEQSLQHLASHSEHWLSRTLSGIKPGRMNAEVFDDDYDIYENIFFRMAIERISEFVSNERQKVERALRQNESLIDWESYANQFNDYKRMELMYKLLPDYNSETECDKNLEYTEVFETLKSIERRILAIQWSGNYQKISKTKVLNRPIIPTNILNMDKNYHEIYRLWNQLDCSSVSAVAVGVDGEVAIQTHESYFDFVAISIVYALSMLDYQIEDSSQIWYDACINLNVAMANDLFYIDVVNAKDLTQHQIIEIMFTEKLNLKLELPHGFTYNNFLNDVSTYYEVNSVDNSLTFYRKPNEEERKAIGNIFKNLMRETEGKENQKNKILDKNWRQWLSDNLDAVNNPRRYKIQISPQVINLGGDEIDFRNLTNNMFKNSYEADSVYFVSPFELYEKEIYDDDVLIDRCLSYGELPFAKNDNYSRGLLPISQIEVNSVTRLMKVFEITATRLAIVWKKDKEKCPVCGSSQINVIDENTSRCMHVDCGTIWGLTRCTKQCGDFFAWTRPDLLIESKTCFNLSYLQLKARKETWFGSSVITDFDLDTSGDYVTFKPRCPHCG